MTDRAFKPKKLDRESLEAPLEPQWRVMGAETERELHEKSKAEYRRFQFFAPRMRRRVGIYALGTAVCFAAVGWLFLRGTLHTLWLFGGAGALLGVVVAYLRPTDYLCGLLYALTGLLGSVLLYRDAGRLALAVILSTTLFFFCVGVALGRIEEFKRIDGED